MSDASNYLDDLDAFLKENLQVELNPQAQALDVQLSEADQEEVEEDGVVNLGAEYDFDTRSYQEKLDLDQDGIITDNIDPPPFNADAFSTLRNLIPSSGSYYDDFQEYLNRLGVEHFTASEVMRAKGGSHFNQNSICFNKNSLAPRSKWIFFGRTIVALDHVRKDLGHAIFLVVAYRSRPYNDCLIQQSINNSPTGTSGVAKNSQHLNFNAIDFRGGSGTVYDWGRAVKSYKDNEDSRVWYKTYSGSKFVHIDTRGHQL
ncbi:MAG: hypothetical protein ABJQ71_18855 [Roseibium sp.]